MKSSEKLADIILEFEELRRRILWALGGLVVTILGSFLVARRVVEILAVPVGGLENLQSIDVTENIGVFMRVALLSGFILALPWILIQLMAFIYPGLNSSERRWVTAAIPVMTLLFASGAVFTYFVMLRTAVPFLLEFLGVKTIPTLSNYIKFVTSLMFWVGVSFEIPVVFFLLAKLGLVTAKMLLKQWKIAVVIITVLAAVITPTGDPVNMGLLMLPLLAIYFLSVLLASIARKKGYN